MFRNDRTDKLADAARPVIAVVRDDETREHLIAAVRESREALRRAEEVRRREERQGWRLLLLVVLAAGAIVAYLRFRSRGDDDWASGADAGYEPWSSSQTFSTTGTTVTGEPATGAAAGPSDVVTSSRPAGSAGTAERSEPADAEATGSAAAAAGATAAEAGGAVAEAGPSETGLPRERLHELKGREVTDPAGERVGTLQQVFLDEASGVPEWVLVATGRQFPHLRFAPLAGAALDGDVLRLAVTAQQVHDAPAEDDEHGQLSTEAEAELCRHYGLEQRPGSRLQRM
jgi:hypothetical protein